MKKSSILYISISTALISISPLSAESIPKIGNTCPQGYHTDGSSGYCVSSSNKNAPQVVPKIGNTCPSGYHTDGSSGYCVSN